MSNEVLSSIMDLINFFCVFFSIIIALIQLLIRKKQWYHYIISILYFSYGIIILDATLVHSRMVLDFPYLLGLSLPFRHFGMVSLYLYSKKLLNHNFKPSYKHYRLLISGFLITIALIPLFYSRSTAEKIAFIRRIFDNTNTEYSIYIITVIIIQFFFLIMIIYKLSPIWKVSKANRNPVNSIIYYLIIMGICAGLCNILSIIFKYNVLYQVSTLLFNVMAFVPFLLNYRYPDLLHTLSVQISKDKYKQSQVGSINVSAVISRLKDLLEIEKIFTNPELNLVKASELLEISYHQLSEILNKELKINFRTYINTYRIEAAKELLIQKPEECILAIAYSVGFNSKATFNTAFNKLTNMTPSEYRNKNLHKKVCKGK